MPSAPIPKAGLASHQVAGQAFPRLRRESVGYFEIPAAVQAKSSAGVENAGGIMEGKERLEKGGRRPRARRCPRNVRPGSLLRQDPEMARVIDRKWTRVR
jgi:hypothetical protein